MASLIHAVGHGLANDDTFKFANIVPSNSGVDEATTYYVLTTPDADTFTFSETMDGTAFVLDYAIESGSIVSADTYSVVGDGIMDPPDAIPAITAPTVAGTTASGIVRLTVALNDTAEAKVRNWDVQVTHKFTDEAAITGTLTGVAATNLLTLSQAHGLVADDVIHFTSLTGGTGLTATGTDYFVIASGLTTTAFRVSETLAGSEVDFSTDVTDGAIADVLDPPIANWPVALTITLPGNSTEVSLPALGDTLYAVRVRAQDVYGQYSAYSDEVTYTTAAGSDALNAALADLANDVPDGIITETKIADDSISTPKLQAGAVTAEVLAATIVLASLIKTAETGRRVELDTTGITLYDTDESLLVRIPTNGDPVYVRGEINASTLVVEDSTELRTTAALASGATMTLQSGVSAPTVAPSVVASTDYLTLTSTPPQLGYGICYDPAGDAGGATPTYWIGADPMQSSGYVAHEYNASTGALLRSITATGSFETFTATYGSTSHVGDSWEAQSGGSDQQIATPMTMPRDGRITKISIYARGYGAACTTRVAIWDGTTFVAHSSTFEMAAEAPSAGGANQYNVSIGPVTVNGGNTIRVGFTRPSGDAFWWDRDDGAGKTTYLGDGDPGDDMSGVSTDSSHKPNIYFTYEYDVDTQLEGYTGDIIGVARQGSYVWVLEDTGILYRYLQADLSYVDKFSFAAHADFDGTKSKAGLFYDGTNLVIVTSDGTGGGARVRFIRVNTSGAYVSTSDAESGITVNGTTDTLRGGYSDGTNYWISLSGQVNAFDKTSGDYVADRVFGRTTTALDGVTFDGTVFRGWVVATPTKVHKFTAWDWTTASAIYWVGYAWYDPDGTTHETAISPRTSLTLKRRERILVTTPSIPGSGGADEPDNARIYMLPNATDPGAGALEYQATDALTSRYLVTYDTSGGFDGAGTPFAAGSPAELRSTPNLGSGGWSLKGSGSLVTPYGTSFPTSPATQEEFIRTDVGNIKFFFDGTRWLSRDLLLIHGSTWAASSTYDISMTASQARVKGATMYLGYGTDIWIESISLTAVINSGGTALSASHKWSFDFKKGSIQTPTTALGSIVIDSGSSNIARFGAVTIDALLDVANNPQITMDVVKTGTPGDYNSHLPFIVQARIVQT